MVSHLCPETLTNLKKSWHFVDEVNLYHCHYAKLRDIDGISFYLSQSMDSLSTLPSLDSILAYIQDLFVHLITLTAISQHLFPAQMWMLMSIQPVSQDNVQAKWKVVIVGVRRLFDGMKCFLGVNLRTGHPYWYSVQSYTNYTVCKRLLG